MSSAAESNRALHEALATRGYETLRERFVTGRPDRAALPLVTRSVGQAVGKVYPFGGGEAAFRNMTEVWASSFGARRRPPGLPRPLEYLPEAGVLVMERLEGRPLAELGLSERSELGRPMALVADLHGSDARPERTRDPRAILRSLDRKANRVADLAPEFAAPIREVVEKLAARVPPRAPLVPSHGDFSPRNVLVAPGRLALIDWDRFQWAEPARDVAYAGVWCWARALRDGRERGWSVLDAAAESYDRVRPGALNAASLSFHAAAGLVRIAHGLVELWPREASLAPRLASEALRMLE
ncbi:MAG: phosphotransferase [Acidobacteriota bacterium]